MVQFVNCDGIDFDGCSHVRVSDSHFKTGDDCLIVRAMRKSADQHVVCEDVIVSDCELNSRCQTVHLGSPSDDVIRNVLFKNIKAVGSNGIFADYPTRYLNSDETGSLTERSIRLPSSEEGRRPSDLLEICLSLRYKTIDNAQDHRHR